MANENLILTEAEGSTATIWLNRPEKHNALDIQMLTELLSSLKHLNSSPAIRLILIRGKGKSFCSGADLNWMQRSAELSDEDNYRECEILAACFHELYHSNRITVCMVHGSSFGGANGFPAVCDIAVSTDSAVFAFSEVRLGIVPATIAPYILSKTIKSRVMECMLNGRSFTPYEAYDMGLISKIVSEDEADSYLSSLVESLLTGSPEAQHGIKDIVRTYSSLQADNHLVHKTAFILAQTRVSPDAREGISSFLEKRKPVWNLLH